MKETLDNRTAEQAHRKTLQCLAFDEFSGSTARHHGSRKTEMLSYRTDLAKQISETARQSQDFKETKSKDEK